MISMNVFNFFSKWDPDLQFILSACFKTISFVKGSISILMYVANSI